ncbi:hypothetical protein CASFOL_027585 [Castilleja foliolosa]|uniref:MLO-like protein n=1 Tax=Castilleja foliolosa TaxID=1961234 RepID=A0ABD3CGV8_9LAMI
MTGEADAEMAAGSLAHTPTWAVATVCFFIISISIILEHSIHLLMNWLKKRHKTVLYDAVGRIKSEFMLLGFLSILLTVTERSIPKICIPTEVANKMLPCGTGFMTGFGHWINNNESVIKSSQRRLSEEEEEVDPCSSKGQVSLVTSKGVEQLELFIFVLAATQIVYSVITVALGRIKMRRWEAWEKETQSQDYQNAHDPNKRRFSRQVTFWKRHEACTETPLQLWVKCFFRQFFSSVAKTDYLTLRYGFITTHLSTRQLNSFNFQKYIKHSLDEDFRTVVSISPLMWFIVVIFMLLDIHGWHSYFWISFVPLSIVLTVGTKLEVIVAKMALQLKKQKNVIIEAQVVELNDNNFWFGQPSFLLDLMHLTLFLIEFGSDSCYHEGTTTIIRMVLAFVVQVICSYITLPHYALVTQMGSQFKGEIFNKKVAQVLLQWHNQVRRARKRKQETNNVEQSPITTIVGNDNNNLGENHIEGSHKSEKLSEITEVDEVE